MAAGKSTKRILEVTVPAMDCGPHEMTRGVSNPAGPNPGALNPLGDISVQNGSHFGFRSQDLAADAQQAVPAWQRETGEKLPSSQTAALERLAILKALAQFDRYGVIIKDMGAIVQGNPGWTRHIATLPTLSVRRNVLCATSAQSQQELLAGLSLLFSDYSWPSVPVALRDLDGWVTDILHIKRVGPANPNCAYVLFPKSPADMAKTLTVLALALELTPLETTLVRLIVKGVTDKEIAGSVGLKLSDLKHGMRELVRKFRVRQRSDIVRLITSFP